MASQARPTTPALATTGASAVSTTSRPGPRSGTDAARSSSPSPPVQTSAASRAIVLWSDSASWSSSSSRGMARDSRAPKPRRASSGADRSP